VTSARHLRTPYRPVMSYLLFVKFSCKKT